MTKECIWFLEGTGIFSKMSWGQHSLIFSGNWGCLPGVKADDPSSFCTKVWVKLYNSTPPYAVMVHAGPTSLRLLHYWVQFCFKRSMYCMYTHPLRKEYLYEHGYISSHCCENLTYSFICNVAVKGSKQGYQTGGPGFILYHVWTGATASSCFPQE
jgi:hypothetical protein